MAETKLDPQIVALFEAQSEQSMKALMEFAKVLRQPTEWEQEQLNEKRTAFENRKKTKAAMAKAEEESRLGNQARCAHRKEDGRLNIIGPVNSDGYIRPTCNICHKQWAKIRATLDQMSNGVNWDQYRGLTEEHLAILAKNMVVA